MRRILIGVVCLVVAGLGVTAVPAEAGPRPDGDAVARLVRSMSLPDKVGQLFVTYAYGATAASTAPADVAQNRALLGVDNAAQLVSRYHLGGVIYFGYSGNLVDPPQIAKLSDDLQAVATSTGPQVPLLISTDQEGGNVTRIGAPVAVSPGNMAIGATFDPRVAYATNRATGQQLRAIGIRVDDAPVVDTNTNPANAADGPRAFGDTAAQTSLGGAAAVLGLQSTGVAATAKHFPGLGSTEVNTDFGVATTDQTRAGFDRYDLPAFRSAIAAGTDEIMAAHIVAPALDPSGAPASLSAPMVTGILRDELHYDGVVVTDALNAEALHEYTNVERSVKALQAGVDQLLIPPDLAGAVQGVIDAVHTGQLTEARIDQSVTRILRLKQKLGLFASNRVDLGAVSRSVGTAAQTAAMTDAARRSVTLYRNDGTLPLASGSGKRVLVTGYGSATGQTLAADIAAKGVTTSRVYTGSAPSEAAIAAAESAARAADVAVVVTYNAWSDPGQRAVVTRVRATGTPTVVLAVGAPYELGYLPDVGTFLAAYGYQPVSLQAATDVLFGRSPTGRSPVTIRTPDGSSVVAAWGSGLRYR